ncbi:MAG: protoporphyrinogen oxidase [Candidatus Poribacteria bacterium]
MIGTLNNKSREVTIIGAGISGLVAAYHLHKVGKIVTIIESSNRVGGVIKTTNTPWGIAESAAHSFLATPAVLNLCDELGVKLTGIRKGSTKRYILRSGKMRTFPLSVSEVILTFLKAYFRFSLKKDSDPNQAKKMTMEEWGHKFLGKAAVKYLITPFLRGIYGASPSEISVAAAYPGLLIPRGHSLFSFILFKLRKKFLCKKLQKKTSAQTVLKKTVKLRRGMMSPASGMGDLVAKLEQKLTAELGGRFLIDSPALELPDHANIILTTPAHEAAYLLEQHEHTLSSALHSVTYTPLISATVFMAKHSMPPKGIRGIGVLMPENEKVQCLGILFNSSSFTDRVVNEEKYESFTVMIGSSPENNALSLSDDEIISFIYRDMKTVLGISSPPIHVVINRWPKAIPKYNSTLFDTWSLARKSWCSMPGRILFGNYTGQISLRGMIESSASLAASLQD